MLGVPTRVVCVVIDQAALSLHPSLRPPGHGNVPGILDPMAAAAMYELRKLGLALVVAAAPTVRQKLGKIVSDELLPPAVSFVRPPATDGHGDYVDRLVEECGYDPAVMLYAGGRTDVTQAAVDAGMRAVLVAWDEPAGLPAEILYLRELQQLPILLAQQRYSSPS
jgi:phosphoglycolate phosphatase-like HAD superfamily hydrolase